MSTTGIILLVLTVIAWLLLSAALTSAIGADGTGDRDIFLGLRWILAGVLICALWAFVGGLLFVAGGQNMLPAGAGIAAAILVPASAASAFGGLYLASELAVRWPMTVAMSAPALLAGYVVLLYLPSLRTVAASPFLTGAVWGTVLVLSIVLLSAVWRRARENDAMRIVREKEYAEAAVQASERKRPENLAKLKAMRPDQHLTDWYPLLEPDSGVRDEALAALRTVERRQGDVQEGLTYGIQAIMRLAPELDLQYTPELCRAAQVFLRKTAEGMRLRDTGPHPYQSNQYLEGSLRSVSWFTAHGCNCGEGIAQIEACVRSYGDTPDRRQMLNLLAGLHESR
jgi:hypothetical protein